VLIEQKYNGKEDYVNYFNYLLPFFKDERYIKVDNKPMFHIYRIDDIPDINVFIKTFNELAIKNGFEGMNLISTIMSNTDNILNNSAIYGQVGMDVFFKMRYGKRSFFSEKSFLGKIENKIRIKFSKSYKIGERKIPLIFDYKDGVANFNLKFLHQKYIACVFPNWDNSARSGKKSMIFINATPKAWQEHLQIAVNELLKNCDNPPFIFIKSWNEWAEGNHLEPDRKFGMQWLEAVKKVKDNLIND
jgi:hypothetical protein